MECSSKIAAFLLVKDEIELIEQSIDHLNLIGVDLIIVATLIPLTEQKLFSNPDVQPTSTCFTLIILVMIRRNLSEPIARRSP